MMVDVLGTLYEIGESIPLNTTSADGVCRAYSKEILYRRAVDMLDADDPISAKKRRQKEVIRHELIHAFFP